MRGCGYNMTVHRLTSVWMSATISVLYFRIAGFEGEALIPWPARSSNPNPLHYFLWGYLKSLVFETPVETDLELVARMVAAYDIIQNTSGIFMWVR